MNARARILRIDIASREQMKARTMAIARGEYKPAAGEPKVWFLSMESALAFWRLGRVALYVLLLIYALVAWQGIGVFLWTGISERDFVPIIIAGMFATIWAVISYLFWRSLLRVDGPGAPFSRQEQNSASDRQYP